MRTSCQPPSGQANNKYLVKSLKTKCLMVFLLILCFALAGCGAGKPKAESPSFSLTSERVKNNLPTIKYDLAFLANQNLTVTDSCWIDQNRLLLLAAPPSQADETGENNLPRPITLFILYTGDNTLEQIYQGEHPVGKLKAISANTVAIIAPDNITIFNHAIRSVDNEIPLANGGEDSSKVALSSGGKYVAYEDGNGGLALADIKGEVFAKLDPKTMGYNWLSNPLWSNDSKHLVFFCGYQPYSLDSIAVINVDNPDKPQILKYPAGSDVFPVWPSVGPNLLVLHNFFNNPDNLPIKIELTNTDNGKVLKSVKLDYYRGFTNVVYANTASNQYFVSSEDKLYLQDKDKAPIQVNPSELPTHPDNVYFSDQGQKVAGLAYDESGNLTHIYIISQGK